MNTYDKGDALGNGARSGQMYEQSSVVGIPSL
jgi:hypothetical protein